MRALKILSIGLALLLMTAAVSSAGVISYTTTIPLSATDWKLTVDPPGDTRKTLVFDQFDSSLGTLTSVDVYIEAVLSTVLTITNEAASASDGTANTRMQLTVQDSGANFHVPLLDFLSADFIYNLGPAQHVHSGELGGSSNHTEHFTLAAILNEFTGTGTISLGATTFTQTVLINDGGGTSASQATSLSASGTVTYNYISNSEVPEPGTIGLLGSALIGLAVLGRKRFAR